jgi:phytoene dehydrogenase-like protein
MSERHVVIVGGGMAGLSAGCYARASGFRATIVERDLALGGVCATWSCGPYLLDGCNHWLSAGPFQKIYEELGIVPRVQLQALERFMTYRDARDHFELTISRDLEVTARMLCQIAPEDASEIQRIVQAARVVAKLDPLPDRPHELTTMREQLGRLWNLRSDFSTLAHFRKPLGIWSKEQLKSERLRRIFAMMFPGDIPALLLVMILGYLKQGYLARPVGGTAPFRAALVDSYHARGGQTVLASTVDEILVQGDRAHGVRLSDGTVLDADIVVSTANSPETLLRLLGGRYGAAELRARLERWTLLPPIALASYGVATPLSNAPPSLFIDQIEPLSVGGVTNGRLAVRVYNEDPGFAPPGHTVVQTTLSTDYDYWAKTGSRYQAEKEDVLARTLARLNAHLPGVQACMKVSDLATPLTFWSRARSWRGACEGWLPNADTLVGPIQKTLPGLSGFFMAGQWVEAGGGVPAALTSGRRVVQSICTEDGRPFLADAARAASTR